MAYAAGDALVRVEGILAGSEGFANVWAFKSVSNASDAQDVADALHTFYDSYFTSHSTARASVVTCSYTPLFTGGNIALTWAQIDGAVATDLLPTECALRLSFRSLPGGTRGGPFLPGFCVNALDQDGMLDSTAHTNMTTYVGDLVADVAGSTPAQMGIHSPTTESVIEATSIRVGRVFDVIRKRRNDLPENYTTITV